MTDDRDPLLQALFAGSEARSGRKGICRPGDGANGEPEGQGRSWLDLHKYGVRRVCLAARHAAPRRRTTPHARPPDSSD